MLNVNLNPQSRLFTIAAWPYFSYGFPQAAVELAFQGRVVRWPLSTSPDDSLFPPHHCFPISSSSWHTFLSHAEETFHSIFPLSARSIALDSTLFPYCHPWTYLLLKAFFFSIFQAELGILAFSVFFQCSAWPQVHLRWHGIENFLCISCDSELVEQEPSLFPPWLHGSGNMGSACSICWTKEWRKKSCGSHQKRKLQPSTVCLGLFGIYNSTSHKHESFKDLKKML